MKKIFLILVNLLYMSSYAVSELYSNSEEIKEVLNKDIYEPNAFQMFLGLFLCIGLIYLTGFIYQKLIKVKLTATDNELNRINIISTTSLGQNKNLHVVEINGEHILIGATQNNITYIKNIDVKQS